MFDILIKNGVIVDGTGNKSYLADIGIERGKISALGDLANCPALEIIDVNKYVVTPGFIDIHNHSDFSLLIDPRGSTSIMQGVTTLVIGNCGFGCAPMLNQELNNWNILGYSPQWKVNVDFPTFGDYLGELRRLVPGPNIYPLVSHGAIRLATMGIQNRPANPDEIKRLRRLLIKSLNEGAKGLSSGLEYFPGSYATLEELKSLTEVIGDGFYSTHLRNRNGPGLQQSVEEAIETIKGIKIHLQISHLAPRTEMKDGEYLELLKFLTRIRENGIDVGYDTIVYDWGPHQLADMLPEHVRILPVQQVSDLMNTPSFIQMLWDNKRSSIQQLISAEKSESIWLCYAPQSQEYVGLNLYEISKITGKTPFEVACEILVREKENFLSVSLKTPFTNSVYLDMVLAESGSIPMSDGFDVSLDGPLQGFEFSRASFGWVPHFLGKVVFEKRQTTLENAIRRVTTLPASYLGLKDRGMIKLGYYADLAVIDPKNYKDLSNEWGEPSYPSGVEYVLINGKKVVEKGIETGIRVGMIL